MSAALFRETSSQRFSRESKEMWEKVQTGETLDNVTRASQQNGTCEDISDKKKPIDKEEQQPVRRIPSSAPTLRPKEADIFPRKVKSKLVKIKPALWEKNEEKLKNTALKKEKRKTKLG
eukprot:TRINITY_DN14825_c0_g1_i1.p1 TRINITY_DN14825_c0_g1~~TRINITY_DN14825_c0_g1_i1.p1  ORF type:complete len:119 (-),score=43.56 TRINITY_DN14825_c0_g1_i1:143-499(-)